VRIQVNESLCQGHGVCSLVDDALFPLDDDGHSALLELSDVPAGLEDTARRGVSSCPEAALDLVEDGKG
jgi:ferredoxin